MPWVDKLLWTASVSAVLVLVGVVWLGWRSSSNLSGRESLSPSGSGSIISVFLNDWDGTSCFLYVVDPSVSRERPVKIGTLSINEKPDEVLWAKDGSLVAVRYRTKLAFCYDFTGHAVVTAPHKASRPDVFEFPTSEEQDVFVSALFAKRGGSQSAVFQPYGNGQPCMSRREAKRFALN